MMRTLGMIGFHQSYTYFAWRNTKEELIEYHDGAQQAHRPSAASGLLAHDARHPHPLHDQREGAGLQAAGVLAATMSPTWGIYSA